MSRTAARALGALDALITLLLRLVAVVLLVTGIGLVTFNLPSADVDDGDGGLKPPMKPHWRLVALGGVTTVCAIVVDAAVRKAKRQRRARKQASLEPAPVSAMCHVCRHDLTGNASGTCPECGTPAAAAEDAAAAAGVTPAGGQSGPSSGAVAVAVAVARGGEA